MSVVTCRPSISAASVTIHGGVAFLLTCEGVILEEAIEWAAES